MERLFVSHCKKCDGGCGYCFSIWNDGKNSFFSLPERIERDTILYPSCDSELESIDFFDRLTELAGNTGGHRLIVSVSTKKLLTPGLIDRFAELDGVLKEKRAGFVKFGVSITTKSMIGQIEPGTAPYKDRIDAVRAVSARGIRATVTLKPILPFIPEEEYKEIVDDMLPHTDLFLLGDLYVDERTLFFRNWIEGNGYELKKKKVGWLKSQEEWYVVESEKIKEALHGYIFGKGGKSFESDKDLIEELL